MQMARFPCLMAEKYSIVYINCIFIHSSVDRHLGYFHILAIVSNAAVNLGDQISIQYPVFISFGCINISMVVLF